MKKIGCIIILFLLNACSSHYMSDGEQRYLKSRNGSAVTVPPALADSNMSHYYDLPSQNQHAEVSVAPPN